MRKYGEGWAVAYFFGLCLAAAIVLIVIGMVIAGIRHRKRREVRRAWGAKWGLELVDSEEYEKSRKGRSTAQSELAAKIVQEYPYVPAFKNSTSCRFAMHMLEGTVQGRFTRVFEFVYLTGSGKHVVEHPFSVVGFHLNSIKGHLSLRRPGWLDKVKDDIQVGRPILDDRYNIYADEWNLLANELPDELARVLEESDLFELVVAVDRMVVTVRKKLKNEAYDRLMEDAIKLADWLDTKR
jgi:hypothetical protein